jgi:hypothetical protein
MSVIGSTYKSDDTEEYLDKVFYRPIGYWVALLSRAMKISPNGITIFSIFVGLGAVYCFYFHDPLRLWLGIFFMVSAELLDSVDGQLARMTKSYSNIGRILDGVASNIIYVGIYTVLSIRLINEGYPVWIPAISLLALISHSLQGQFADFYRNCYLQYAEKDTHWELQPIEKTRNDMKNDTLLYKKILFWFLYQYTFTQMLITREYQKLIKLIQRFGNHIPDEFYSEYKQLNKPNIKYYNILTSNTRMIALIIAMIFSYPLAFFGFEIIVMNLLMFYVAGKQNAYAKALSLMCPKSNYEVTNA